MDPTEDQDYQLFLKAKEELDAFPDECPHKAYGEELEEMKADVLLKMAELAMSVDRLLTHA